MKIRCHSLVLFYSYFLLWIFLQCSKCKLSDPHLLFWWKTISYISAFNEVTRSFFRNCEYAFINMYDERRKYHFYSKDCVDHKHIARKKRLTSVNFSPENTAVCSRHSKTGQVNKLMMHVYLFRLMRDDLNVHLWVKWQICCSILAFLNTYFRKIYSCSQTMMISYLTLVIWRFYIKHL